MQLASIMKLLRKVQNGQKMNVSETWKITNTKSVIKKQIHKLTIVHVQVFTPFKAIPM